MKIDDKHLRQLERKERELWGDLRFLRETPKAQWHIPFVNEYDTATTSRFSRALRRFLFGE